MGRNGARTETTSTNYQSDKQRDERVRQQYEAGTNGDEHEARNGHVAGDGYRPVRSVYSCFVNDVVAFVDGL